MTNILDQVAQSSARVSFNRFQPTTTRDVFALSLARKLGDAAGASYYAQLSQQYPVERLLHAFRQAIEYSGGKPRYRVFHDSLKTGHPISAGNSRPKFCAIRIERRAIAIVIMHGENPEYMRVRQLSSDSQKALTSAAYFVSKVIRAFPVKSAGMEIIPNGHDHQRSQLIKLISSVLRESAVSILEVAKRGVFETLGHPPLRSRKAVREVIQGIYQFESFTGSGAPFMMDALALGLHIEIERLLLN